MCCSLHWDGTSAGGLAACPICIGVANTNRSTASAHFCLGYIPHTPGIAQSPQATECKYHVRQQCLAAILNVLESVARHGFICRLKNRHGVETVRLLKPRLMAMNMDQPEAQLSFGMRNRTSCSKCKWRKGRSAFRKSSFQSASAVKRLYRIAQAQRAVNKHLAASKLRNWGFNPNRRCCLLYTGERFSFL
jgi:hypothetical protein